VMSPLALLGPALLDPIDAASPQMIIATGQHLRQHHRVHCGTECVSDISNNPAEHRLIGFLPSCENLFGEATLDRASMSGLGASRRRRGFVKDNVAMMWSIIHGENVALRGGLNACEEI
jgi:hypothetical protein